MFTIKYAIKNEYPSLVEMDPTVISLEELVQELKDENTFAMRCRWKNIIVGYYLYTLHKDHVEIIGFMVHPDYRYNGVGSEMMASVANKLTKTRNYITLQVHESNLDFQLFLKKMGFTANVNRGDDYYTFTYAPTNAHCLS